MQKLKSGLVLLMIAGFSGCQNEVKQETISNQIENQPEIADTSSIVPEKRIESIPDWVSEKMKSLKLDELYQLADFAKPSFIEGNFNNDNLKDVAALIFNKKTFEKGLLILHNGANKEYTVYGAGTEIQGMKDLDWIEIFERIP
ncbi:hypothetical protein [Adhaeribacter terreus]|uniref:Lipoprotein n=1 Tax=Adhaeribacter terreus TaxID=529703 RepID=A0ABW0EAJ0_9BACT